MDLKKFAARAKRKEEKLTKFLRKLDEIVPEDFSALVEEEDKKVWQKVDCTTCANCCKTMTPTYNKEDIRRISKHLGLSQKAFYDKYLTKDPENGDIINQQTPCPFLGKDDRCTIYEVRPKDCADYPHHFRRPFDEFNDTFIQNLHHCPATLQLIEQLEKRVNEEYDF